jgi:hypothetical protein
MSELTLIQQTLRKAAARRRLDRALRGLWLGMLGGSGLWLLCIVLYKIAPISSALAEWGWIAALGGGVLGFVMGGWRRVSLTTAARILEDRHALNQRVSTALEVASTPVQPEWSRLIVTDAANAVRGVDPAKLFPFNLPALAKWIPLVLVLIVGLGFVPEYRSAGYLKARRDAELIRDTGRKMTTLVRRELERPEMDEPVRQSLEDTLAVSERLSQAKLTRAEAIQDLANAARRLEEDARQLDSDPLLRRLQQAARTPHSSNTPQNSALQRQLEKMQDSTGGSSPEALDKLAEKLQQARQMAAAMNGAAPETSEQQALSQVLSQLSQSTAEMGLNLSSLDDALNALKNLDVDRVLRDLALAGDDLEKLRDMARKLAEMQQNMAQLGRDLAEQLERGQAEAAANTLDKMIEQLKASDLSPEQMQRIMSEVAKALKPAADYGKVAELLKSAGERMSAAQREDASTELAQAAAELRKMAEQATDLQQLVTALQALEGAQLALINDRLWQYGGMCKGGACAGCSSCKGGKPGFNPRGRKPGRGVGTWADESGWLYYPEMSERWDNTGIERPDMAPRGQTDRGEGEAPANTAPTKLTGQFSPGQMPAITLKGVSIKGQSSVAYQQAVQAAQSSAQSALSQDQVPRAYRGAVKDYFDDL